jgi:anti-sigma regulatory factor (Ser/Thr protein kinase)
LIIPAESAAWADKQDKEASSAQTAVQCALIIVKTLTESMSAHFTDISVRARSAELPGLLEAIAAQAAELGIAADDAVRLQLIVEELFSNTITHGHHGDSEHGVTLSLHYENGVATLHYEDDAPAFDISKIGQKFASTAEIGGLGISLIRGMSKALRHQRRGPINITEVDL